MNQHSHQIFSDAPADIYAEGYPIGNGRLAAMISGDPLKDRVALNHDRLWRRYWKYPKRNLAAKFKRFQQLCLEQKWDEASALVAPEIQRSGFGLYVNPFVPLADIGIYPDLRSDKPVDSCRRRLDLSEAVVTTDYHVGDIDFKREYFASFPHNVIVIRLSASEVAAVSGEFSLYRMPDRECSVTAESSLDELTLTGKFEEGVKFAAVVRVIQTGGRLTSGITDYMPPAAPEPPKFLDGFAFGFRDCVHPEVPAGISTCVDSADSVTLLVKMATDRETDDDLADYCRGHLDKLSSVDYETLKQQHIEDHQSLYNRVELQIGGAGDSHAAVPHPRRIADCYEQKSVDDPKLVEGAFDLARYLAIAAGRPAGPEMPLKAPMNLQGIWNEDPRPAWDCDYHLDLNLQMCYWGLGMVNLAELGRPLIDWAYSLLPQAEIVAADIYGLPGACYSGVCDVENIGNYCQLAMLGTGCNAWLAQSLYQFWQYCRDTDLLRDRIYPVLREISRFYQHFLVEDSQGRLVPAPSHSPENFPQGRVIPSALSAPSAFDLELIRELLENTIEAHDILNLDDADRKIWPEMLDKIPLPTINSEGRLLEWLEQDYATLDPGHRHRSHLVGICPGTRISVEETAAYAEGVAKAIELRLSHQGVGSCTLDLTCDAYIFARLYQGEKSLAKINELIINHSIGNLLLCLCDWRPGSGLPWFGDRRVFQIEASFGLMSAVTQMLLQDHQDLIRILPALPAEWPTGYVSGLLTRTGHTVDIHWDGEKITKLKILSLRGEDCKLKIMTGQKTFTLTENDESRQLTLDADNTVGFATKPQTVYTLTFGH
ncbi:MAG: glycoside hydrolase family 95 protein [Sedimentisphaerales bacterium]|nr:glycoside hydrolase family 95 protein [Sedimentisphaerales bacterium]